MICIVLSLAEMKNPKTLLDIGSGSGHWVDYFLRIFSNIENIDACEISKTRCEYLSNKYTNEKRKDIHNVSAEVFPVTMNFDIVCMIGCAFHIVDDKVLLDVLSKIGSVLNNSSVLIFNDLLPI
jgi:SAM-dependent methyltransferase